MTTIVGNYELVRQLASGGMAEAHVARSLADGAIVVIKQLLPQFAGNPEFIEMFIDEGRVISSLRHPNVVALREFGFHAELPFLAMEYLHGIDLRTLMRTLVLRKKQRMPADVALYIASSMCAGLHHAHEARTIDGKPMDVTHRDVSPQNVVLTFDGAVKLIDFGIATARGRTHQTRAGAMKGKIRYMAPEQVRTASTDRRADIYATGVVLYELLAHRRPYIGKKARMGEFSLMMAIVNHDVVPMHTIRPDLPGALAQVIMKAIALDPANRYQTAAEMRSELHVIARELGMTLTPRRLAQVIEDAVGGHKEVSELASSAEIIDLVLEVDAARTQVDERHDPITADGSQVSPLASGAAVRDTAPSTPATEPDAERVTGMVVDKIIEHDRTRLRFLREPDPGFRWARMLDGVEGAVEIDFTGVIGLTAPAIAAARDALQALGAEVSKIQLIGVPIALAAELDDRCRIISASCRGRCPSCKTRRVAVLEYEDMRARLSEARAIPCPQCGTQLLDIELSIDARDLRPSAPYAVASLPVPASNVRPAGALTAAPSQAVKTERIARRLSAPMFAVTIVIAACTIAVMAGVLGWHAHARRSERSTSTAMSGRSWREGQAWVAEVSGDGASEIAALTEARLRGLALGIAEIEAALPERFRPLCGDSLEVAPGLLDRPPEGRIDLEQLDAKARALEGRTHVTVRYKMAEGARERALDFYSKVESIWGLELINAPPSRRAGLLVIGAPFGPVSVGDRIISVGGRPLRSLDSLHQLGELRSRPTLDLVIERQERRTLGIKNTESP